ncbi:MAG: type I-U CRISPR-associated helicase/endonuclease Cas3 [Pirellulaceae bacterium]|nr:type I-U CRISPR-associated helicase/endonuclease Cas3 [Pirellulaceae bacterium]
MEFNSTFKKLTDNLPFPWQCNLYDEWLSKGRIPSSCNIPTGLGKTSVIAVWLIALANGAKLPRRLCYVVNRRTVVDQTTEEVEMYRCQLTKAGLMAMMAARAPAWWTQNALAISTLRGQFADNREWSVDPTRPAIICGTVDMIGSRLLFGGYRVGFKAKPLHAGFLGQDTLLIHDEAHLEPAFQRLIERIQSEQTRCSEFRRLEVMELTATTRKDSQSFGLTAEELDVSKKLPDKPSKPLHVVWQRLKSPKGVAFIPCDIKSIAKTIGETARNKWAKSGKAILIFVRKLEDVRIVETELTNEKNGGVPASQVRLLTGTMRGFERDKFASKDAVFARFMSKPKCEVQQGTVFLICTSAGEVGVDISTHHLVCDLTTLDSMAQRFGRVNRRGEGEAEIDIVYEEDPNPKSPHPEFDAARWNTLRILQHLAPCDWIKDRLDASPIGLSKVMESLSAEQRQAAFAPEPVFLEATDILFDAWALTTIRKKMPGRPAVAPYLHGLSESEPPQTEIAWREEVERITGDLLTKYPPGALLADYPIKPHEVLREPSYRAFKQLDLIQAKFPDAPVWLVDDDGTVDATYTLRTLIDKDQKQRIEGKLVLLPLRVGGLKNGMLDGEAVGEALADIADECFADKEEPLPLRKRFWNDDSGARTLLDQLHLVRQIEIPRTDGDDSEQSDVWLWYKLQNEGERTAAKEVDWETHVDDVVYLTGQMLSRFELGDEIDQAISFAAKFHDHGKLRAQFQLMLGNSDYPEVKLAKSGRKRGLLPEVYRHEFGSLIDVMDETLPYLRELQQLSPDARELALHLIASHHGRARPAFPRVECYDPERSQTVADEVSTEVPRRFARLQRKYGRWGLAYLESILRAADWSASAQPGIASKFRGDHEP